MATIDDLEEQLARRDAIEQVLVPYFNAFTSASTRAIQNEAEQGSLEKPTTGSSKTNSPEAGTVTKADTVTKELKEAKAVGNVDRELIERLKLSRKALESRLSLLQNQLDEAQERARATAEVEYLKTHAVQGLHDEILALTMQLNMSEEKRKKLQDDLGR